MTTESYTIEEIEAIADELAEREFMADAFKDKLIAALRKPKDVFRREEIIIHRASNAPYRMLKGMETRFYRHIRPSELPQYALDLREQAGLIFDYLVLVKHPTAVEERTRDILGPLITAWNAAGGDDE